MAGECGQNIPEYNFNNKYRGQALIFVNKKFDDPTEFPTRYGAGKDRRNMKNLFNNLDFKVKVYRDFESNKIVEKLRKAARCEYNIESDCFACVFSSHGSEEKLKDRQRQHIIWKNTIYGKDCRAILVEDIPSIFSSKECPGLANKPKMFFIQACRSREEQQDDATVYDFGYLQKLIDDVNLGSTNQGKDGNQLDEGDQKGDSCKSKIDAMTVPKTRLNIKEMGDQEFDLNEHEIADIYMDWKEEEDFDEDTEAQDSEDEDENEENEEEIKGGNTGPNPDKIDAGGSADSGSVPDIPQELVPIEGPNDCLILYPIMPGAQMNAEL